MIGYYIIYRYSFPALVICLAAVLFALWLAAHIHTLHIRQSVLALYVLVMLYFTVGERMIGLALGTTAQSAVSQLNLSPFWSYGKFNQVELRWQVYMNVFLFIPFGFMLPWCSERLQKLWKVVLIAAIFSILTEAAQYFLRIGLCETDDVIHNTLGAVIGYGYWRLLSAARDWLRKKRGREGANLENHSGSGFSVKEEASGRQGREGK